MRCAVCFLLNTPTYNIVVRIMLRGRIVSRDFAPQHVSQLGLRKGDIVVEDERPSEVGADWRHVRHSVETVRTLHGGWGDSHARGERRANFV